MCASVADSIEALSNLGIMHQKCIKKIHSHHLLASLLNASFFKPTEDSIQSISLQQHLNLDIVQDGWKMYSTENEFKKLQKYIGSEWRLSYVNEDFKV